MEGGCPGRLDAAICEPPDAESAFCSAGIQAVLVTLEFWAGARRDAVSCVQYTCKYPQPWATLSGPL